MLKDKLRWIYYSDMLDEEYKESSQEGKDVSSYRSEIDMIKAITDNPEREAAACNLLIRMENHLKK